MQKGNPLLKHVRNVKWVFADVVCDYVLGDSSCALYLRYFQLQVACPPLLSLLIVLLFFLQSPLSSSPSGILVFQNKRVKEEF